jgi:hypothetical protein
MGSLVLGLALLLPLSCQAQAPADSCCRRPGRAPNKLPTVVVVGANANGPRLPLMLDAIVFWNLSFAKLGTYSGRFKKTGRSFFGQLCS